MPIEAIISELDKVEIVRLYKEEKVCVEKLARRYKTHYKKISNIIREINGSLVDKGHFIGRIYSKEENDEIVRLYRDKVCAFRYIVARFKSDPKKIKEILLTNGIKYQPNYHRYVEDNIKEAILKAYTEEKLTLHQIKDRFKLTYQQVRRVLRPHGFIKDGTGKLETKYPKEVTNNILLLYQSPEESVKTISEKLSIGYSTIRNILIRNGVSIKIRPKKVKVIKIRPKRIQIQPAPKIRIISEDGTMARYVKYWYYHKYFEKVDSHEKAYVLGFLAADGCNAPNRGAFSMTLHERDREILEKINREFSPNKPLAPVKVKGVQSFWSCRVSNKKMSKDLEKLGIVQAKTFKLKVEDWMTGEYANSAILGLMDGDGSFYYRERFPKGRNRTTLEKTWTFSFIGLRPLCEMMQKIFKEQLGIHGNVAPHTKYKNNLEKPLCTIRVHGNGQNKILMDWLYKDSKLFMKRKHDNYLNMLEFIRTKRVNQFG